MRKLLSGLYVEWNCPLIKCHAMKTFRDVDTDPSIFNPDTKQTRVANFKPRPLCPWNVMLYVHSPCVSRPKDLYSSYILCPLNLCFFPTSVDNNRLEFSSSDWTITVLQVSNSSTELRTCFPPRRPVCTLNCTLTWVIVHSSIFRSIKWFP